jgi:hypothetical protein
MINTKTIPSFVHRNNNVDNDQVTEYGSSTDIQSIYMSNKQQPLHKINCISIKTIDVVPAAVSVLEQVGHVIQS